MGKKVCIAMHPFTQAESLNKVVQTESEAPNGKIIENIHSSKEKDSYDHIGVCIMSIIVVYFRGEPTIP